MEVFQKICLIILAFCALSYANVDKTPVIIWANHNLNQVPTVQGGHSLSSDNFQKDYLPKLLPKDKQNVLLFLQDKLSLGDIASHADVFNSKSTGSAFHNLKDLLESQNSLSLPSVHHAGEAVKSHLQSLLDTAKHELHEPYDLSKVPLHEDTSNIITVHLPSTVSGERQSSLSAIDKIIGTVTAAAKKLQAPFTALYTAEKPFQPSAEYIQGRHLLAVEEGAGPIVHNDNASCVLFYAESITITGGTQYNTTITNNTVLTYTDKCANGSASITFTWAEAKLSLSMEFGQRLGFWYVINWGGMLDGSDIANAPTNLTIYDRDSLASPEFFSYHCFEGPKLTFDNGTVTISINGMQVQPDPLKKQGKFGRPNDCVGFFTITIWSWIIVMLLLLSILAFGITMVANITTMDRFDDPKGKSITVNAPEG